MSVRKTMLLAGTILSAAVASLPAAAQTSAAPYTSAQRFDALGRVTGTIAPDPDGPGGHGFAAVRNTYDGAGRLIRVETGVLATWQSEEVAPASWSGFTVHRTLDTTYDARDRKTRDIVSALPATGSGPLEVYSVTQQSYDDLGRPECTAVRMNPAAFPASGGTGGSLPASACVLGTEGTFGPDRITQTIHDEAGQRVQLRVAVGTDLEATDATWAYDGNGQVTTVIDSNGNRAELRYDGFGRQNRWVFPSPTRPNAFDDSEPDNALATAGSVNEADYELYGSDLNGNRTSFRNRAGQVLGFTYDALNRVTAKDRPGLEQDVVYSYDLRGLQLSAAFYGWQGVDNVYDGFGRLTSSSVYAAGATRTISNMYDAEGNRIRITHPDGVYYNFGYDGRNRLTQVFEQNGAFTQVAAMAYHPAGERSLLLQGSIVTQYRYDGLGRLTLQQLDADTAHDHDIALAYNPAGQIVSRVGSNDLYTFAATNGAQASAINGLNQVGTVNGLLLGHDDNGNLTVDAGHNGNASAQVYVYDSENRLIQASGAQVPGGSATFDYDALGRLRTLGASTTHMVYDGDHPAVEYSSGGAIVRRTLFEPGENQPLVTYGASGRRMVHRDEHGSVIGLSDGTAAVVQTAAYDEYGNPAPGAFDMPLRYTGQRWLGEAGIYHYRTRIYFAQLGRFGQRDSVGYDGGVNLYEFAASDPLNLDDPDGTCPICPKIVVDAIIETGIQFATTGTVNPGQVVRNVAEGLVNPFRTIERARDLGRAVSRGREVARRPNEGIVYRRTNPETGRCYIGRCNTQENFERRQRDHDRQQGARHRYEILERAQRGRRLREAEQRQINSHGGPTNRRNPNGGTENRRNEIRPDRR